MEQNAAKPKHEVKALLHMTQIVASGSDLDVNNVIGDHECSEYPPSMFENEHLIKDLIKPYPGVVCNRETAIEMDSERILVVDAIYVIRKWSFQKGQRFDTIADNIKMKHNLFLL